MADINGGSSLRAGSVAIRTRVSEKVGAGRAEVGRGHEDPSIAFGRAIALIAAFGRVLSGSDVERPHGGVVDADECDAVDPGHGRVAGRDRRLPTSRDQQPRNIISSIGIQETPELHASPKIQVDESTDELTIEG